MRHRRTFLLAAASLAAAAFAASTAGAASYERFDITTVAKSWDDASAKYFGDGGVFDSFSKPK